MQIGFVSADLMFPSKIRGVVSAAGGTLVWAANFETVLERIDDAECPMMVIDLTTPSLDLLRTVQDIRKSIPTAQIVGFGPHVAVDLLRAAKEHVDLVLVKSQFEEGLAALIGELKK